MGVCRYGWLLAFVAPIGVNSQQQLNLFEATFANGNSNGFSYVDDAFRQTSNPAYASGAVLQDSLQVTLGGIDNVSIVNGMSGAWQASFVVPTLASSLVINLSLGYQLTMASDYEANEFGEVLVAIDNTSPPLVVVGSALAGDGNGGSSQTTGPQIASIDLGSSLPPGPHTITVGAYNNQKTFNNEVTTLLINSVVLTGTTTPSPITPPVPAPVAVPVAQPVPVPSSGLVFQARFDQGTDGFEYRDDTFRNTAQPASASGSRSPQGYVEVTLGGGSDTTVQNMSGGWVRSFQIVGSSTRVRLSLRYELLQAGTEEADELSQALVSIDGALVGQKPYDELMQIRGNGNSGPPLSTGWKTFVTEFPLSAGQHTIVIGGYLNKKTLGNEITTIRFDDVTLTAGISFVDPTRDPQQVVSRLSFDRFKNNIATLASFGDRLQGSSSYFQSASWLENQLRGLGYSVQRAPYTYRGLPRDNIYVTKVGTAFPDRMFIVSAHLDGRGNGGAADDDASGCSLVLEMARVLADPDVEVEVSVRLVWWNNEESGLNGSTGYVNSRQQLQGQESPAGSGSYPEPTWLGMIQHDMILFDHSLPPRLSQNPNADNDIEYQASSIFAAQSQVLANALLQGNQQYSEFYPAEVSNDMSNTDSVPFQDFSPSCSFRENRRRGEIGNGSNPQWHQPTDVYSTYSEQDFLFGFNIVQTTVGTVAELANLKIV